LAKPAQRASVARRCGLRERFLGGVKRAGGHADACKVLLALESSSTSYHVGEFVGLAFGLVVAFIVARKALRFGFGRARRASINVVIAAIAVVVGCGLLVSGANRGMFEGGVSGEQTRQSWSSPAGLNIKAGFMAGCTHGQAARDAICACILDHLTTTAPYNTPQGFESLKPTLTRFAETGSRSLLPRAFVSAVNTCAVQERS
jgi:hypothetical protein